MTLSGIYAQSQMQKIQTVAGGPFVILHHITSHSVRLIPKGTQGFIHCLFKAASLATLNKQILSSLATY